MNGERGPINLTRRGFLGAASAGIAASLIGCRPGARPEEAAAANASLFNVVSGRAGAGRVSLSIEGPPGPWLLEWGQQGEPLSSKRELAADPDGPTVVGLDGLASGARYAYKLTTAAADRQPASSTDGFFHTPRPAGELFVFTITTDSHLIASLGCPPDRPLHRVVRQIAPQRPDFHVTGGDEAMTHAPMAAEHGATTEAAATAYRYFRSIFAPALQAAPLFYMLGNHEGEGWIDESYGHTKQLAKVSRIARQKFVVNPHSDTYSEGGAVDGNYYAWTWGDALFVVLDPYTYSTTSPSKPEDWTLGPAQWQWLESVLRNSPQRWKVLFQHQLVGGAAYPAMPNSPYVNYGRGGAQFARVGEQARIHDLMRSAGGQIIFKGHDHIFTDEQADGIRYTTCGRLLGPPNRETAVPWALDPEFQRLYPGGFEQSWGFIRAAVSPDAFEVAYIDYTGKRRGGYTLRA